LIFFAGTAATLFVGTIVWKEYIMKDFGQLTPPQVNTKNHEIDLHGVRLSDPYAWLRDTKWKTPEDGVKNQEILDYLKAENTYTDAFFKPLTSKVKEIFEERRGFLQTVDESVPIKRDNYFK
jgi:oligopeptidase B